MFDRLCRITDTQGPTARPPNNSPPPRGAIEGMSRKARRRLLLALAMVSRLDPCHFVTLTYCEFSEDFEEWHLHLDSFSKALARRFPEYCGFWRLQFQQRGAPHFHLILWLGKSENCAELSNWFSITWSRITRNSHLKKHLDHGADVQEAGDFRQTGFYLSLYQGKGEQDRTDIKTGRLWGMLGRSRLRLVPLSEDSLNHAEAITFHRLLRRHYASRHRGTRPGRFIRNLRVREQRSQVFLPVEVSLKLVEWIHAQRLGDPF